MFSSCCRVRHSSDCTKSVFSFQILHLHRVISSGQFNLIFDLVEWGNNEFIGVDGFVSMSFFNVCQARTVFIFFFSFSVTYTLLTYLYRISVFSLFTERTWLRPNQSALRTTHAVRTREVTTFFRRTQFSVFLRWCLFRNVDSALRRRLGPTWHSRPATAAYSRRTDVLITTAVVFQLPKLRSPSVYILSMEIRCCGRGNWPDEASGRGKSL